MKSKILSFHNRLINKQISFSEYLEYLKQNINRIDDTNTFITKTFDQINITAIETDLPYHNTNLLYAVPYALKDCFMTKGIITTAGSKFLKNYVAPYDSTVYELLNQKNCLLIGKTNMDEFAVGGTGMLSFNGYVHNIYDHSRITGGSSSGSVNAVAADCCLFALGSDTGDSTRRPSTFLGTVGYKPTYGLISRYGAIPYSPSLDHVGVITNYVADCAIVLQQLAQFDPKDFTSISLKNHDFFSNLKTAKNIKLNVLNGIEQYLSANVVDHYHQILDKLKSAGIKLNYIDVDWEILGVITPAYKMLSFGELVSCYRNFSGVTFGSNVANDTHGYQSIVTKNRSAGFGKHAINCFLIGEYVTQGDRYEKLFLRAKKFRTLLIEYSEKLFANADGYLIPGASCIAPLIKEIEENTHQGTLVDELLQLSNFNGSPSISIPTGFVEKMPFGININTKKGEDQKLLNIALSIEEIIDFNKEVNHD